MSSITKSITFALKSHGLNRAATQSSQSLVQKRSMTMTMRKFSAALAVTDAPEDPSSSNNPTSTALPVIDATREMDKNPKLNAIVDSIASLSLLEVSNLVTILKAKFNIKDIAMPVAAAAAAGPVAGNAGAAAQEEAPKVVEKTEFKVILEKFDASAKAKVIREIKGLISGFTLVQAKNFVESAPKEIKGELKKEEAEAIKKSLEAVGATVKIE